MPVYEILCVASARTGHHNLAQVFQKCTRNVMNKGGTVRAIDNLGVRPLAYRMKSHQYWHDYGRYVRFVCETNPYGLRDMVKTLQLSDSIVRWLVLKEKGLAARKPLPRPPRTTSLDDIGDGSVAALRRLGKLDYLVARYLLARGKLSPEDIRQGTVPRAMEDEELQSQTQKDAWKIVGPDPGPGPGHD